MTRLHPASCICEQYTSWTQLLLTSGEISTEMWYSLYRMKTLYFSPSVSFSLSFKIPYCCSVYGGDGGLWFLEKILRKPLGRFYHVKLGNYKHLIVEERSEAPACIEILQIGVWGQARGGWTWNIEHTIFGYKPCNQQRGGWGGREGGLTEKYVEHIAQSTGQHLRINTED